MKISVQKLIAKSIKCERGEEKGNRNGETGCSNVCTGVSVGETGGGGGGGCPRTYKLSESDCDFYIYNNH